ncbi:MAG: UDP-2,3-diacylglucosamine diphosphatase LpxI domain-containing protein [Thermodesulforhabdaceae bacterium]
MGVRDSDHIIGLIAGGGQFPIVFSDAAKECGFSVIAIGIDGDTSPVLSEHVDRFFWVKLGEAGKIIDILKTHNVHRVVFAGYVDKKRIYSRIKLDWRGARLAMRLLSKNDDALLRAFAEELEKEGITVEPSTLFLKSLLAPEGVLSRRVPGQREIRDIEFGWKLAKAIGSMDVGQCVVVKHQAVLAVEAIDGTDATILRGGQLCGNGAVVVKVSKPNQDLRFDVPAVGLDTIESMKKVGATVLAVEAGKTLMFDREAMIEEANKAGISVVGISSPENLKSLKKIPSFRQSPSFFSAKLFGRHSLYATRPIRIAVIGAGYLGRFHIEKLVQMPSVEFKAIVDINEERARFMSGRFKVPYFTSHRDIMDQVDAVTIVTPTETHFKIARDFLNAGVHVFVEKPMTLSLEEADTLIDLADRNGCILQVGHIERFNPAFQAVRERITSPSFIQAKRLSRFKERSSNVDVVMDLMIHDLDLILSLVPYEVSEWQATGMPVITDLPDVAFVRMVFFNGLIAQLEASRICGDDYRKMEIIQEGTCIVADYKKKEAYEIPVTPAADANQPVFLNVKLTDALEEELKHFLESIRSGTKPMVDGRETRRVLSLAIEISKAISDSAMSHNKKFRLLK